MTQLRLWLAAVAAVLVLGVTASGADDKPTSCPACAAHKCQPPCCNKKDGCSEQSSCPKCCDKQSCCPNGCQKADLCQPGCEEHQVRASKTTDAHIQSCLSYPITLDYREAPLRQIVEDLQSRVGVNVVVDLPALSDARGLDQAHHPHHQSTNMGGKRWRGHDRLLPVGQEPGRQPISRDPGAGGGLVDGAAQPEEGTILCIRSQVGCPAEPALRGCPAAIGSVHGDPAVSNRARCHAAACPRPNDWPTNACHPAHVAHVADGLPGSDMSVHASGPRWQWFAGCTERLSRRA
jgi:hypothetical protein